MAFSRRTCSALFAAVALLLHAGTTTHAQPGSEAKKPSLSLRVTPPVGFAPLRSRLVVDVRGGDDDFADFYCPTIEWDWGDGTVSENAEDCDPYQAGKSVIRRRFSIEHIFQQPGAYRIAFRLKQRDKVVGSSSTQVQVRAGISQP